MPTKTASCKLVAFATYFLAVTDESAATSASQAIIVLVCVVETLVIIGLLLSRVRSGLSEASRRDIAASVEAERRHLNEVISNVPGVVWESRLETASAAGINEFVSNHVEKMLGYTVREWLSKPCFWLSIVHEDDRDRLWR